MNTRAPLRNLLAATLASGLLLPNTGCLLLMSGGGGNFLEGDDVRLGVPSGVSDRAGDPDLIIGDVYQIVDRTIADTNGWVTGSVEGIATIYRYLDRHRETSRDGEWRVYGPYQDDDGRDLAWLVKIAEPAGVDTFEFYVGPRAAKGEAEMDKLIDGELKVEDNMRSGGFSLYFDAIEAHPEMKDADDALHTYQGSIHITFERDTDTEAKSIDIDFDGFKVLYDGFLDEDSFESDESYNYRQNGDGTGTFHLALLGPWDDWGWSGPESERLVLDMAWTAEGSGRARGQILESADMGDLKHGDLVIDECFKPEGYVIWRQISDAYLVEVPDYDLGVETECPLAVESLPG